jgi:hypothetical protein
MLSSRGECQLASLPQQEWDLSRLEMSKWLLENVDVRVKNIRLEITSGATRRGHQAWAQAMQRRSGCQSKSTNNASSLDLHQARIGQCDQSRRQCLQFRWSNVRRGCPVRSHLPMR